MKALPSRRLYISLLSLPAFLFAGLAGAASAQDAAEASVATLPDAATIIDRYTVLTKMATFVAEKESMRLTGTVSIEALGIEGPLEIQKAKPNKYHVSIDLGAMGGRVRNGSNGKVGWSLHPMTGARVLEGLELLQLEFEAAWDASLLPAHSFVSRETIGKTVYDGVECYEVELVVKPLAGMDAAKTLEARTLNHFFEVESGLRRGDRVVADSPTGKVAVEKVVTDYKVLGGALVGTKVVQTMQGMSMVFEIAAVEVDGVDPAAFVLPDEIASQVSE